MTIELLGIIIGTITLLFVSWGAIWFRLGKVTAECKNIRNELKDLQKQVEHIIINHCDKQN